MPILVLRQCLRFALYLFVGQSMSVFFLRTRFIVNMDHAARGSLAMHIIHALVPQMLIHPVSFLDILAVPRSPGFTPLPQPSF
jgi:hypothetical protein